MECIYVRISRKSAAVLAALLMITNGLAVKADDLQHEADIQKDSGTTLDQTQRQESATAPEDAAAPPSGGARQQEQEQTPKDTADPPSDAMQQQMPEDTADPPSGEMQQQEQEQTPKDTVGPPSDEMQQQEQEQMPKDTADPPSDAMQQQEQEQMPEDTADLPSGEEQAQETAWENIAAPPAFHVFIKWNQGWTVYGTFTEFAPDTTLVQPMYSIDGENWQPCGYTWNLYRLGTEDPDKLHELQNQPCLNNNSEPLKSYLAGELGRFYLKLEITRENGTTYDSQAAVIEHSEPQPVPEEISAVVQFAPSVIVREYRPVYRSYGKYQLTVSADASAEDISALLPDTLPVEIDLFKGGEHIGSDITDCPVAWKPLSLPRLTAGESVTIQDAAGELVVPAGTAVNTVLDTFRLTGPLSLTNGNVTLVLNVVPNNANPTGVLRSELGRLEIAFDLKPTGATDIRAYTLTEGAAQWIPLSGVSLLKDVNAQPSTASSAYTLLLDKSCEPYRSYLEAETSGREPTPFLIGLEIKGGVYDGRQLILPWPGTYDLPPDLPKLGGSQGNEANAGSSYKGDGTEQGQRPNLPLKAEEKTGGKTQDTSPAPQDQPEMTAHPNTLPENGPVPEIMPKQEDGYLYGPPAAATQPATAAQAAADTQNGEIPPATDTIPNMAADSKTEITTPQKPVFLSAQEDPDAVPAISQQQNENGKRKKTPVIWKAADTNLSLPIAAFSAIGVCAVILLTAAASGIKTMNRPSGNVTGKILRILRRLFHIN